ncbi:MAG: DUF4157 domain-containing protein, partial [bacterium]
MSARDQAEPGASPSSVAERGVKGQGGALPHAGAIQAAFGRHDVSGVRAHQSAAAAQSAELLAANAYAIGEDVAFAEQPDLHTAAHEAAHVVQQRGGVQLSRRSGRSGRSGDAYEQHADAVADAVVAGESAEALLDAAPGGGGGVSRAVQRQDAEAATGSAGEAEGEEDPSPREQLEAALGGWGADQQEVTAIIRDASPAEKREMLGDAALMRKLAGAFDTEDMLTVLDAFEAPLTLELETAMRGWGCDAAAIKRLVAGAAPAERAAVLADAALVERLASELSQEDMLILLEAAGAPLDQRLSTAMNGWGCDAEAIRRLVTNATPAEKTALLADAALVERLASELSQEDMLAVLEQAGAPLAMRLNAAMSGWGCDAAAIKRLVSGATPADKAALLGDAAMVERLAGELSQEDMVTVLEQAGAPLDRRLTAAMDGWGCDAETIKRLVASATPAERAAVLADAALVERLAGELSQGDVLIVLGQVGAPLGRRLDAAMNGWGCDAEAVVQLVKGATPAEQAAVLADAALVERLAGELNRDAMSTVLEEIGAPLGQQLTTAMDGWGCDAATIVRLIRAAPAADQAAVAVDYALTTRLEDELPEADWHTVCRVLFDAANGAGDIATMRRLFESRFGVAVGSAGDAEALAFMPGGAEAAFGPNGLSRIYHL